MSAEGGARTTYDPATASDFPKGFVLSEYATPHWSNDGSRVFVGIKEQEPELAKSDDPAGQRRRLALEGRRTQSVQIVRLQQELRATFASAVLVPSGKFVQLADSAMRTVQPVDDGSWAVGRNDTTYRGEVAWGGSHADYYRVNTATGDRTLIDDKLSRTMGTSPDSKWFLYLQNQHIYAYNAASGTSTQVDGGMNFVNRTTTMPTSSRSGGVAGWSKRRQVGAAVRQVRRLGSCRSTAPASR